MDKGLLYPSVRPKRALLSFKIEGEYIFSSFFLAPFLSRAHSLCVSCVQRGRQIKGEGESGGEDGSGLASLFHASLVPCCSIREHRWPPFLPHVPPWSSLLMLLSLSVPGPKGYMVEDQIPFGRSTDDPGHCSSPRGSIRFLVEGMTRNLTPLPA